MVKPDFFIVGAPKSGTTSLYTWLKQHPGVYLPKKEIYYFCYDLGFTTPPLPEPVYLNYYTAAPPHQTAGDASSYYLLSPGAAKKINQFNPGARIIMLLRNPVEMVHALHSQHVFNGNEPLEDFEKALDAESSRRQGKQVPPNRKCPLEALYYSTVAKYYGQVLRYKDTFPENQLHIIFYDDFKNNTEAEYRKVLKFLGLEEIMPASFDAVNPNKEPRSRLYRNLLANPPGFVKAAGRVLFPHHSRRREKIIDRLYTINMNFRPRKQLPQHVKQRLADMYKEDIGNLGKLLNRDLSEWLKI